MKKLFLLVLFGFVLFLGACDVQGIVDKYGKDSNEDDTNENSDNDSGTIVSDDHKAEDVTNIVKTLKDDKGFYIKYKAKSESSEDYGETSAETIAFGANKDIYYYAFGSEEHIFDASDKTKLVSYEKQEDGWTKEELVYAELGMSEEDGSQMMESYFLSVSIYMTMYQAYEATQMIKTTATIAGRSCDKYTTAAATLGAAYSFSMYIDKATGICLKWEAAGSSVEGSGSASFECLDFKTSYNITIPTNIVD